MHTRPGQQGQQGNRRRAVGKKVAESERKREDSDEAEAADERRAHRMLLVAAGTIHRPEPASERNAETYHHARKDGTESKQCSVFQRPPPR
jgi:hypothetical protein